MERNYNKIIKRELKFCKEDTESFYEASNKDKIRKAEEESARLLKEAEVKAEKRLKEAEDLIRKDRETAYSEGYMEGIRAANEYVQQAKLYYEEAIKKCEKDLIELAIAIAKKILNEDLKLHSEEIVKIAKEVIKSAGEQKHLVLKVNPDDLKIIEVQKENLKKLLRESAILKIIPEKSISKGSCILETEIGSIEGNLDLQLKEISEILLRRI